MSSFVRLDVRSLSLLRWCLALTVLYDLYDRSQDLSAHYSDDGVLNRLTLLQLYSQPAWVLWPHLLVGSQLTVRLLFSVHALIAVLWMLGWQTGCTGFLVWVLHCSLQIRNPLVNHGGDQMLHCVLFWTLFLPMNRRFSLDAIFHRRVRTQRDDRSNSYVSLFGLGLLLQVSFVYSISYVHKSAPHWYPHGTATEMALGLDYFRTPLGTFILSLPPPLLRAVTVLVWLFEGFGPLLYFLPFQFSRLIGCLGFAFMHLMFGTSLRLGIFALVGIVAQVGFLPPFVWHPVERWLQRRQRTDLLVCFDAHCDSCARLAGVCARVLGCETRAVSETPRRRLPFVVDCESKQDQVLLPRWLTAVAGAMHRHRGRECHTCVVADRDEPPTLFDDFCTVNWTLFKSVVAVSLIGLSLLVNLDSLGSYALPEPLFHVVSALHLDQHWAMFAPHPPIDQFWYSIPGETIDGTKLELFQRGSLRLKRGIAASDIDTNVRPSGDDMFDSIGNQRWFKYFENGINTSPHNMALRLEFGRWICRQYNYDRASGTQLYSFDLRLHVERIQLRDDPLERQPAAVGGGPQILSMHKCYDTRDSVKDWPQPNDGGRRRTNDNSEKSEL